MATSTERATECYDEMATRWLSKVGDDFRFTVGSGQSRRTLVFYKQPQLVRNKEGTVIGIECWVRLLDRNGNVIPIDEHRVLINPPTVPRSGVTWNANGTRKTVTKNVGEAVLEALLDSISTVPGVK